MKYIFFCTDLGQVTWSVDHDQVKVEKSGPTGIA